MYSNRAVQKALKRLGFKPAFSRGRDGHSYFIHVATGKTIRPVIRHKDIHHGLVYSLSLEMLSKGLIGSRRELISALRKA